MEPLISPEEYRAAILRFNQFLAEQKQINEKLGKHLAISFGLMLAFIILALLIGESSTIRFRFYTIAAVGAVTASVIMFAKTSHRVRVNQKNLLHFKANRNYMKAISESLKTPHTPHAADVLREAAEREKDPVIRSDLLFRLGNEKLIMGDAAGAYSCITNDPEVFAADRLFEMHYCLSVAEYYCEFGNGGGREYFEQAYRRFAELLEKEDRNGRFFINAADIALDMMIDDAYMQGEWQKCFDRCALKCEVFANEENSITGREAIALYKLRQAECMYNLGEYHSALMLCDAAGPVIAHAEYQARRANGLAAKIRQALEAGNGA